MSSDGGLGGLLGNLFGGKSGGIGKVLQDLLSGGGATSAPGATDKLGVPMPETPSGPIQPPGSHPQAAQPQQPGMPQPGMQQPGMQQPGMPQPGMQQPQPGMPQSGMPKPGMPPAGIPQGGPQQPGVRPPQVGQPGMPTPPPAPQAQQMPAGAGAATAAGGAAASATGLDQLLNRLRNAGLGDQVSSWLSDGPNKTINPQQVTQAVGSQQLSDLAKSAGVSPDEVANGLAKALPDVINEMTPHGQIPSASQVQSSVNKLLGS